MMGKISLKQICHEYENDIDEDCISEDDRKFVGLKIKDNKPSVYFPLGYSLSNDEEGKRQDILLLLTILRKTLSKKQGRQNNNSYEDHGLIPYLRIILDYMTNGYFKEREITYVHSKRGKISWARTVKRIKPYFQEDNILYMDFIVRKSNVDENAILTQIHKYCVYKSFLIFGWLFTEYMPPKALVEKPNILYYSAILQKKLQITFNDYNRQLISDMKAVLLDEDNMFSGDNQITLGTYRFEYPWQIMIDAVFSRYDSMNHDKSSFFPTSIWIDESGKSIPNSKLLPDTVMVKNKDVFILDAKYYKYGIEKSGYNLPATSSVQKQISYGEHAKKLGYDKVYSAFLLPFACKNNEYIKNFGYAYAQWKTGQESYQKIYGVFVDTKWLMSKYLRNEQNVQDILADEIDKAVDKYKFGYKTLSGN